MLTFWKPLSELYLYAVQKKVHYPTIRPGHVDIQREYRVNTVCAFISVEREKKEFTKSCFNLHNCIFCMSSVYNMPMNEEAVEKFAELMVSLVVVIKLKAHNRE